MSSAILQGSATGTGSVTLLAPVTNATRTITLPDSTGVIPGEMIYRLNANRTGLLTTAQQSVFGVGITVNASTVYQFEGLYAINKTGGAGGQIFLSFGGTATVNNIGYTLHRYFLNTNFTDGAAPVMSYVQVATAFTDMGSSTSTPTFQLFQIRGQVSINAGGTFIPQLGTGTAVAGTLIFAANSYFKLSPIAASGANTNVGGWA